MKNWLLLLFIFANTACFAQPIVVGGYQALEPPKVYLDWGLNQTNFFLHNNGVDYKTVPYTFLRFDLNFEYNAKKNIYCQFGINYAFNGVDTPITPKEKQIIFTVNAIEIPVNVMMKFGNVYSDFAFVGTGVFLDFNLSGIIGGEFGGTDMQIGSTQNSDLANFGVGFDAFGGFQFAGYHLKLGYQLELLNLSPRALSGGQIRYQTLYLTYKRFKHRKSRGHYTGDDYHPGL